MLQRNNPLVPVEVLCSLVAIQGDRLGVMTVSIETCPKAVGSETYVTFAAYDAVNEGCIFACKCFMEHLWCLRHCGKKDMSSFGLRTNLVSTPYHYSSNGYRACRRAEGARPSPGRVGFLQKLSWGGSDISVQCLFNLVTVLALSNRDLVLHLPETALVMYSTFLY